MTELSGTLEGVGLPAIVRFLTGLKKTGCLRIVHDDWQGEIVFEAGQLTGASLGSRNGLSALDGLVQALPGGTFTFDTSHRPERAPSIDLSSDALLTHLDELVAQIVKGSPRLPSVDSVPVLVAQDESGGGEDPLPLDRGTLQTLLAVDGQRTVREIVAHRGSFDALWQLGNLAEVGLVRLTPRAATVDLAARAASADALAPVPPASIGPAPVASAPIESAAVASASIESAAVAPASIESATVASAPIESATVASAPIGPAPVAPAPQPTTDHCPKLGFDDDPGNSFGRPTRLHRCFAAGTPLPLSLDQQRELCLSDQFGTCPRLSIIGRGAARPPTRDVVNLHAPPTIGIGGSVAGAAVSALPPRRGFAANPAPATAANGRSDAAPVEPEADRPRIVHLPFGERTSGSQRGGAGDRPTGNLAEPTQLRAAGSAQRESGSPRPTPLRARIDRATSAGFAPAKVEPIVAPTYEPRPAQPAPVRVRDEDVAPPRIGGVPLRLILVGAVGLIVVAVVAVLAFLLASQLDGFFADDSSDLSTLPNASAIAAGTPIADIAARLTPAPTVASTPNSETSSVPNGATSASAASAAAAPAAPTLVSDAAPATPEPTAIIQAPVAGAPAAAAPADQPTAGAAVAAAPATGAPADQPAAATVLDEQFVNNARNWPSNAQGTAWLTSGSYRLIPRQVGQFVAIGAPIADVFHDVVVSATFRKLSGTPAGGGFGIILRDQGPAPLDGTSQGGQYYVLEVGDKGEVGIWRRDADQWVDLLPWQHADAVHPGTATNELTVSAIGTRLSLSVNGTQVVTQTDSSLSSGRVGLLAGGDGNQVAVDHFTVQTP